MTAELPTSNIEYHLQIEKKIWFFYSLSSDCLWRLSGIRVNGEKRRKSQISQHQREWSGPSAPASNLENMGRVAWSSSGRHSATQGKVSSHDGINNNLLRLLDDSCFSFMHRWFWWTLTFFLPTGRRDDANQFNVLFSTRAPCLFRKVMAPERIRLPVLIGTCTMLNNLKNPNWKPAVASRLFFSIGVETCYQVQDHNKRLGLCRVLLLRKGKPILPPRWVW